MNDLFKANMSGIEDLWKRYRTPMKRTFNKDDAFRMLLNDVDMNILDVHV
jgi:hypothetical protein